MSEEGRKRIAEANKKRVWTREMRKKLSESHKGEKNPMFGVPSPMSGKKHTKETLKLMSDIKLNENNPMWAGDNVKLPALHRWVERRKPKPKLCVKCKKVEPRDLANISGEYRRDINDFEWLCRKCHMTIDGRLKNLNNQKC